MEHELTNSYDMHSQEELIVRWLFAEIIYLKYKGRKNKYEKARLWAFRTKIQKIIYNILEENDIPVTRSWYLWGKYVHSNVLQGDRFNSFRKRYHEKPDIALNLRERVSKLGFSVEDILESLYEIAPPYLPMDSNKLLRELYEKDTPSEIRGIYLSKHNIYTALDSFSNSSLYNDIIKFLRDFKLLSDNLSSFHLSSFNLIDNDVVQDAILLFSDNVESALEKVEYMLLNNIEFPNYKIRFFNRAKDLFFKNIWNMYGCRISQNTVKGWRSSTERDNMKRKEQELTSSIKNSILDFSKNREELNLELTWDERESYKKYKKRDEGAEKIINEIIKIYNK